MKVERLKTLKWLLNHNEADSDEKTETLCKALIESALENPNKEFVIFDWSLSNNAIPATIQRILKYIQTNYSIYQSDFVISDRTIKFTGEFNSMDKVGLDILHELDL